MDEQVAGIFDRPRVRVEVREDADTVAAVHGADEWPPAGTRWTPLHLAAGPGTDTGALTATAPTSSGSVTLDARTGIAGFTHRFDRDTEIIGPMALRLKVELPEGGDVSVFATVRKFREGREVTFEGSYGFRGDAVSHGMLAASLRATDPDRSLPGQPHHPFTHAQPLAPGETVAMEIELAPSATLFRAGEELRLDISGRWPFAHNPLTGMFPAAHRTVGRGRLILHIGGTHEAALLIPVSAANHQ